MTTFTQRFNYLPPNTGNLLKLMKLMFDQPIDFRRLIEPETTLEKHLISHPEFLDGYNWGTPRFGHPEGKVGLHVKEVLNNVDKYSPTPLARRQLRLIALSHDTFKFREEKIFPRDWSKHHGALARKFMEQHIDEPLILDIIELHDEAYYVWRHMMLENEPAIARRRLDALMKRLDGNLELYFLFFKCDTETGDKIQAPLRWFERIVESFIIAK
jgi:hypothetical protein